MSDLRDKFNQEESIKKDGSVADEKSANLTAPESGDSVTEGTAPGRAETVADEATQKKESPVAEEETAPEDESPGEDDGLEFITLDSVRDVRERSLSASKTDRGEKEPSRGAHTHGEAHEDGGKNRGRVKQRKRKRRGPLLIILIIVIIIVVVLICLAARHRMTNKKTVESENEKQPVSSGEEYETDIYEDIDALVAGYYTCYADGDVKGILQYASPMSDDEKSYIEMYSEFVDDYDDIVCYAEPEEDGSAYIVAAEYDVNYADVDTPAPGLDFFYVRSGEDGSVYIDNTYSSFNRLYQEYPMNQNTEQMIDEYESDDDAAALQAGVRTRYDQALDEDANLKTMVTTTIADAVDNWEKEHEDTLRKESGAARQTEENEDGQPSEGTGDEASDEQKDETSDEKDETSDEKDDRASDKKDDRASDKKDDQASDKKDDQASDEKDGQEITTNSGETVSGGEDFTLTEAVNIRSDESEDSDRLGVAFGGDEVTIVEVHDDGWTEVTWDGQTGYIKTDVLKEM